MVVRPVRLGRRALVRGLSGLGAVAAFGPGRARGGVGSGERVLERARSDYNEIVVTERDTVRTMYFVADGTWYIESRWDTAHPRSLDLDYTRTMMAGFLVRPEARRLCMIGFGGGQISTYLFERIDGMEVDGVDIDPEVVRLARTYFGVPHDPRYRTHVADGRLFVERTPAGPRFDMIVLDAFRGVFVPYHLKTRQFYEALRARLAPGGVVVANLHHSTRMYPHDRATFDAVFPSCHAFASERGLQTTLVACRDAEPLGTFELRRRARSVAGIFDFDVLGLASRRYRAPNYPPGGRILEDGFDPADLPEAVERHNRACHDDCPYPTH
ncbi:MAG: methyltransferase domain-containing protein [Deltaproteobacteria bacterium]|nr:MAG: methyltransferase domain-containing protein [Deltaproteobacteria bacterium]